MNYYKNIPTTGQTSMLLPCFNCYFSLPLKACILQNYSRQYGDFYEDFYQDYN